jgi:hypothetical protein
MKKQIFVLFYKQTDMTDERTGEKIQGTSVWYVNVKGATADKVSCGYPVLKEWMALDAIEQLKGPGVYEATVEEVARGGNKSGLKVTSLSQVKAIALDQLLTQAVAAR